MQIVDFTAAHIGQAAQIAIQNYGTERRHVPALPLVQAVPGLTPFAENGLGVAAFEDGEMVGFLCAVGPFENVFRSTDAVGVFSPMGANGAAGSKRAGVYARMYQAAGKKWMEAGASSHAVCLYAHDKEAQEQFYRYGFGMRTVDALRVTEEIEVPPCEGYIFEELLPQDYISVFPLDQMLNRHQCESPFFMNRKPDTLARFMASYQEDGARFFAAKKNREICAYLKILRDGETFLVEADGYIHIGGAYCLPEHRGKGVYANLLNHSIRTLKTEGYTRLGVDFESINPAAWGFWSKYFSAYTYGVVRRIDENVMISPA